MGIFRGTYILSLMERVTDDVTISREEGKEAQTNKKYIGMCMFYITINTKESKVFKTVLPVLKTIRAISTLEHGLLLPSSLKHLWCKLTPVYVSYTLQCSQNFNIPGSPLGRHSSVLVAQNKFK